MKKLNLIVASSLAASLLNNGLVLPFLAQSFSSALLTDAADGAGVKGGGGSHDNAQAGDVLPGTTDSSAVSGSASGSGTTSGSGTASGSGGSVSGSGGAAGSGSESGTSTGAVEKSSPAAMCPSPSFPFSFGPDGKATLNSLPPTLNKAAVSTFARLLKEHLLTPSGLLSIAMNRAPGAMPSDFLLKSGKFDGLLLIIAFVGSKVELSDSQIEQLQKVRNTLLDKSAPINADLTVLERKFRDQLIAPQLDDKAMRSLRRQISRDKDKLDALMTEHMIATSHVFTAEQRQKVRDVFMRMQAGPMGIKRPQEKKTTGD